MRTIRKLDWSCSSLMRWYKQQEILWLLCNKCRGTFSLVFLINKSFLIIGEIGNPFTNIAKLMNKYPFRTCRLKMILFKICKNKLHLSIINTMCHKSRIFKMNSKNGKKSKSSEPQWKQLQMRKMIFLEQDTLEMDHFSWKEEKPSFNQTILCSK